MIQYKKQAIRLMGMVIVGSSVFIYQSVGLWFIIPWIIGWFVYDFNVKVEN